MSCTISWDCARTSASDITRINSIIDGFLPSVITPLRASSWASVCIAANSFGFVRILSRMGCDESISNLDGSAEANEARDVWKSRSDLVGGDRRATGHGPLK
jgi:hypothetical protein